MLVVSPDETERAARAIAGFVIALRPLWRRRLEAALARKSDVRRRLARSAARAVLRDLPESLRALGTGSFSRLSREKVPVPFSAATEKVPVPFFEAWSAAAEECFAISRKA